MKTDTIKSKLGRDEFLKELQFAAKFVSRKNIANPEIQDVCLVWEKDKLYIQSTNLAQSYRSSGLSTGADVSEVVMAVVNSREITDFLQSMNVPDIALSLDETRLSLVAGKHKGSTAIIKIDSYPVSFSTSVAWQEVEGASLERSLEYVLFSAASDLSRPALTGVKIISTDDGTLFVCTDGFRLSLSQSKSDLSSLSDQLVPAVYLRELSMLMNGKNTKASLAYDTESKTLYAQLGRATLTTRLIEGDFPPYEKVIPTDCKMSLVVDREELLQAVKVVSVFAREGANIVVFECTDGHIVIRPKKGVSDGSESQVDAKTKTYGEDSIKVAFNYRYVIDFLQSVDTNTVTLRLLRPDAPVFFIPGDATEAEALEVAPYRHIIMPVRVQE